MVQRVPAIVTTSSPTHADSVFWGTACPVMQGSQCPCAPFQCSLYLLLIQRNSEGMPLSLTNLPVLHALLPTAPWIRSQSRSGLPFRILTAAAFFCPPLLFSGFAGHLSAARLIFPSQMEGAGGGLEGAAGGCSWGWAERDSRSLTARTLPRSQSAVSPPPSSLRTEAPAFIRSCERLALIKASKDKWRLSRLVF